VFRKATLFGFSQVALVLMALVALEVLEQDLVVEQHLRVTTEETEEQPDQLDVLAVAVAVAELLLFQKMVSFSSLLVEQVVVLATATRQPVQVIPALVVRQLQALPVELVQAAARVRTQMMVAAAAVVVVEQMVVRVERPLMLIHRAGNVRDVAVTAELIS